MYVDDLIFYTDHLAEHIRRHECACMRECLCLGFGWPSLRGGGRGRGLAGRHRAHGDRCGVSFACDGAAARTQSLKMTSYRRLA